MTIFGDPPDDDDILDPPPSDAPPPSDDDTPAEDADENGLDAEPHDHPRD